MLYKKRYINLIIILSIFLMPFYIYAYSSYIIASGKNVGIKLNSNGVMIVGTYDVNGINTANDAGLEIGDTILKIENKSVNSIDDMVKIINSSDKDNIKINYKRKDKENTTNLKLISDGDTKKTGLYVKDSITGIGTLTYIDPNTKIFGALGHEIIDSSTNKIFEANSGEIFDSYVTSIIKSNNGEPGEKNATFDSNKITGTIKENTIKGIFGTSNLDTSGEKLYKVGTIDDINLGKAKIKTVIEGNNVGEFDINIVSVKNTKDDIKNIVFEITDENLLSKTNGIVQGMSGSPIIQNDKIVGAVTHVVVEDPIKGFGILITNMLEEGEN